MHRKLDVKTHYKERIRLGVWSAILNKMLEEESQSKDVQGLRGTLLDMWEKSILRSRKIQGCNVELVCR